MTLDHALLIAADVIIDVMHDGRGVPYTDAELEQAATTLEEHHADRHTRRR